MIGDREKGEAAVPAPVAEMQFDRAIAAPLAATDEHPHLAIGHHRRPLAR